jgi:hypothetical protein
MPRYKKPFTANKEVMDVFCCVVDGKNTVKSIIKELKQPQSTISEKLRFMVKEHIIIKDKWNFEPNWKMIINEFQCLIREQFRIVFEIVKYEVDKKNKKGNETMIELIELMNNTPQIFNEKRIKRIVEEYSDSLLNCYLEKMPLSELAELYLNTLKRIDTSKFKSFGKDILKIKEFFNKLDVMDMEETLFTTVEGELK